MTTIRSALDPVARAAVAARTEELFRSAGGFKQGHFLLTSGRHADAYLEKFAVLADPAATSELVSYWTADYRGDHAAAVDLVAGPTMGGVPLAFELGRQLGRRAIFAESVREPDGSVRREFRRGFRIEPGQRVVLVDDILTTGFSLHALIPAVEAQGGEIVAVHVLVDRSGEDRATITSPSSARVYALRSLWQLSLPSWEAGPATCPRCTAGDPLYAPGSTGTGANASG